MCRGEGVRRGMLVHATITEQTKILRFTNKAHGKLTGVNLVLHQYSVNIGSISCQLGPRYEGQMTRMSEPIPPSGQSSSYSLTTLSSSSSTDRRAEINTF